MTHALPDPAPDTTSSSTNVAAPLPVAVVGNGRSSRYCVECLTLDPRFTLAAQFKTVPLELDAPSLAAVFVLNALPDRQQAIAQCLHAGLRVVTESPAAVDPAAFAADADVNAAAGDPSRVLVLRRNYEDPDFRRACQVIADGEAGDVRHVEYLLLRMAAFFLPAAPDAPDPTDWPPPAELEHGALTAFGPDLLAQTLTLIPQPVVRVFATLSYHRPEFGPVEAPPGVSRVASRPDSVDTGFRVWLEFDSGQTAQLTVDLAAHADVVTGWTLQTTRGGYRQSRQVLTEPDGEIYDVPVEPQPNTLLDAVATFLASDGPAQDEASSPHLPEPLFSLQTEFRVLKLLEAIRESAAKQQAVTCQI